MKGSPSNNYTKENMKTDHVEDKREKFVKERELFMKLSQSSVYFVYKMWGFRPQVCKPEYQEQLEYIKTLTWDDWEDGKALIGPEWFGDYDEKTRSWNWYGFEKGKHITWQQYLILLSVDKAIAGHARAKITIASGHGIGKSSCISWLILWFLFGRFGSQVPCTAPTANQMYDVLWKELSIWISKMPPRVGVAYQWNKDYIRMSERPNEWFARAKTSSKENSEALAGVHAEWVMTVADEASGVEEQIFNVAEGAWTSGNILVVLISNPTRNAGYFYDTHHKLKHNWQRLQFSSIESPIVDKKYEGQIAERHGRDSDEYGIRVKGQFPKEDSMDDGGFIPLLTERDISVYPGGEGDIKWKGTSILGVDPSGEGDDKTVFVMRDNLKAKKIFEEATSNAKGIAEKIITLIEEYELDPSNVVVDNFGVGANVAAEVAIASRGRYNITAVNVGEPCDTESDQELYENKRAYVFYEGVRRWLKQGGMIAQDVKFQEELLNIRYKRNIRGRIQIMSKVIMKKKYGFASPNVADAFSLTFLKDVQQHDLKTQILMNDALDDMEFDPYEVI